MLRKLRPYCTEWIWGTFCLLIPALCNSFPLVTPDSGAYISNAWHLYVPLDRPLGYSVLLRAASLGISMWGVVIAQAALVAALLLMIAASALGIAYRRASVMAVLLLTGVCTGGGWFAGQLMPDIFTAVALLAVCLMSSLRLSRGRWLLLCALLYGCVLMHNSNGLILSGTGAVVLLRHFLIRGGDLLRKTGLALIAVSAAGLLTLSALNAVAGLGFRPSAATHVFIMGRMVENGIAGAFLHDHCLTDSSSYPLCAYKDKLPLRSWDFMWNGQSPLAAAPGWSATEKEYNRIIRKTLTTPKYLAMHLLQNALATVRQLPLIYIGDGMQQLGEGSGPHNAIARYDRHELSEYTSALQQTGSLRTEWWNALIVVFALGVIAAALLGAPSKGTAAEHSSEVLRRMMRMAVLFIVVNAAVTATFSTVLGRYEARVFWVLPFLCTLYLVKRQHASRTDKPIHS